MKALKVCYVILAAVCAVSLLVAALAAEETKNDPQPPMEQPTDAPQSAGQADPIAEWKEIAAKKLEIQQRLVKLQGEFKTADTAEKLKIRREFQAAIDDFEATLLPRMIELAPKVYETDPNQFDAGEIVMQELMKKNLYAEALAVADKLTAAGHKSMVLTMTLARANFALHNFEKSKSTLEQTNKEERHNPREQQEFVQFLKDSGDYVELWKKEQEIRAAEDKAPADKQNPRVEMTTSRGKIVAELFEDQAPNTVANFISLVESKAYDGTKFHRVIPNFMIQGGDPNSRDDDPSNDGGGGPGYTIKCECFRDDTRQHFRGSLSMAHTPEKDTGGSQFFITHLPTAHLNGMHTVFGRVLEGQEVVDAVQKDDTLETAVVLRKRDHEYKPEVHKRDGLGGEAKGNANEEKK